MDLAPNCGSNVQISPFNISINKFEVHFYLGLSFTQSPKTRGFVPLSLFWVGVQPGLL